MGPAGVETSEAQKTKSLSVKDKEVSSREENNTRKHISTTFRKRAPNSFGNFGTIWTPPEHGEGLLQERAAPSGNSRAPNDSDSPLRH
jgi:hypothetical protein